MHMDATFLIHMRPWLLNPSRFLPRVYPPWGKEQDPREVHTSGFRQLLVGFLDSLHFSKPPASWPSCFTCGCPFWWCKTWTGSMLFFNHNRFMAIDFGFAFQSKTWNSMTHTKPDRLWIRNSWVAAFSPLSFGPSCVAKIWTNHAWDGLKHALTGANSSMIFVSPKAKQINEFPLDYSQDDSGTDDVMVSQQGHGNLAGWAAVGKFWPSHCMSLGIKPRQCVLTNVCDTIQYIWPWIIPHSLSLRI